MQQAILTRLRDSVLCLNLEAVRNACEEALEEGISPLDVINEMSQGMTVIGQRFERQECFLGELIMAGEVMKECMKILGPQLRKWERKTLAKVVLGTVEGDLHEIGKNVFASLLEAAGFEVLDLGVDTPAGKFVEAVRDNNPKIVGLSALITPAMGQMRKVIEEIENAGLRENVRILVGGAPITKEFAEQIDADAYASDAVEGVNICKEWMV